MEVCPIPEVGHALLPYIKSREEVTAIRNGLQSYLESQLGAREAHVSPVTLPLPLTAPLTSSSTSLTGVRRAYWKALQAHSAAQAKYDSLRFELEQLKHKKPMAGNIRETPAIASINEHYVPLLRQKEKQRKLKVIEKAYSTVMAAGEDLSASSLEDVVKKRLGEAPTPPTALPVLNQNPDVDAQLLELKKALISTNRSIEERRKVLSTLQGDDAAALSPQAHIAGLQSALQELTGWMESQLAVIAETEPEMKDSRGLEANSTRSTTIDTADISNLYQQYLEARTRLIRAAKSPPQYNHSETSFEDLFSQAYDPNAAKAIPRTAAEVMLPYIPSLLAGKQHEQSLLQQSAYMRQQMSSAEAETQELIHRLAGESHLVPPGASRGEDWMKAAGEAELVTQRVLNERIQAGKASAESAQDTLQKILKLPEVGDLDPN